MWIRKKSWLNGWVNDVVIAASILVVGLFVLESHVVRRPDRDLTEVAATAKPEMVFRGVSIRERAAETPAHDVAPPPAAAQPEASPPEAAPPAPPQAEAVQAAAPRPEAASPRDGAAVPLLAHPGRSSRSGTVIELVYQDRAALMREAARYGFLVARLDEPAPSRSIGSIDCPGFRLYFDRALYRRIDREIGPLSGLPGGALVSVALDGGRLRRVS